jgi:hypothetical protein
MQQVSRCSLPNSYGIPNVPYLYHRIHEAGVPNVAESAGSPAGLHLGVPRGILGVSIGAGRPILK